MPWALPVMDEDLARGRAVRDLAPAAVPAAPHVLKHPLHHGTVVNLAFCPTRACALVSMDQQQELPLNCPSSFFERECCRCRWDFTRLLHRLHRLHLRWGWPVLEQTAS
jgi:hypothetical protein